MIRLVVVLLTFVWGDGDYGFSTMGVGAILGNGHGIQEQNYFVLLPGNEMRAGFHYRNWVLAILDCSLLNGNIYLWPKG